MARRPEAPWTAAEIGDQRGRTVVVTGANTGIGFETARLMAAAGARVVLACQDAARGAAALQRLRADGHDVSGLTLDLASLASVRAAAGQVLAEHERIDVLICNAGVMMPPPLPTADGFEPHLGVNHLGHFALTGLLLERLTAAPAGRVVVVSSLDHRRGRIEPAELGPEHPIRPMAGYARSKLANLLFAFELDRRLRAAAGTTTIAVAAHPGGAATEVIRHSPLLLRIHGNRFLSRAGEMVIHSPAQAALPSVRAAVDPGVRGGDFLGPAGRLGLAGPPVRVRAAARAHDPALAARLWRESERLTGVHYL